MSDEPHLSRYADVLTWIDDLGHNEVLFDPRVFALVADAIGRTAT